MVRHRTPAGPFPRPRRPMRAPVPDEHRQPEIRRALPPRIAGCGRLGRMEAGERLDADAAAGSGPDHQSAASGLPQLTFGRSPIFETPGGRAGFIVPRLGPTSVTRLSECRVAEARSPHRPTRVSPPILPFSMRSTDRACEPAFSGRIPPGSNRLGLKCCRDRDEAKPESGTYA